MAISPSALRADIYRILDEVIATGRPVEVNRRGRVLRIVVDEVPSRLDRLVERPDFVVGDPADIVEVSFADDWSGGVDLDPA